jgi:hypothetical protein
MEGHSSYLKAQKPLTATTSRYIPLYTTVMIPATNLICLQVPVSKNETQQARQLFTGPGSQVHQLVPPAFNNKIQEFYDNLGHPVVDRNTVWNIFKDLIIEFQNWDARPAFNAMTQFEGAIAHPIPLLPDLRDLPFGINQPIDKSGSIYLGGRPEAFQNLSDGLHANDADFDNELDGYRIEEIPYLEIDETDVEPELEYLSEFD